MPRLHPHQLKAIAMDEAIAEDPLETLHHIVMLNDAHAARAVLCENPQLKPNAESLCHVFMLPDSYAEYQTTAFFVPADEAPPPLPDNIEDIVFYDGRDCATTPAQYAQEQVEMLHLLLAHGANPLEPAGFTNRCNGQPLDATPAFQALVDHETGNIDVKIELVTIALSRQPEWRPDAELSVYFSNLAGVDEEDMQQRRHATCTHMAKVAEGVAERIRATPDVEARMSIAAQDYWLRPADEWKELDEKLPRPGLMEQIMYRAAMAVRLSSGAAP